MHGLGKRRMPFIEIDRQLTGRGIVQAAEEQQQFHHLDSQAGKTFIPESVRNRLLDTYKLRAAVQHETAERKIGQRMDPLHTDFQFPQHLCMMLRKQLFVQEDIDSLIPSRRKYAVGFLLPEEAQGKIPGGSEVAVLPVDVALKTPVDAISHINNVLVQRQQIVAAAQTKIQQDRLKAGKNRACGNRTDAGFIFDVITVESVGTV